MATRDIGAKLRVMLEDLRLQIEDLKDQRENILFFWERSDYGMLHELGAITTRELEEVRKLGYDRPTDLGPVRSQETRYARPKSRARSRR